MVSATWEILKDFSPPKPTFLPESYPDLTGKVVAITGTSAGIGFQTAKLLLLKNACIIAINRNPEKTAISFDRLVQELSKEDPTFNKEKFNSRVFSITIDLGDLTTIKSVNNQLNNYNISKIDYVIFNAGVMQPPKNSKTAQGFELQIGTNVLGHHLLMKFLHPYVMKSVAADFTPRVVWVTSIGHFMSPKNGGIDFNSFKDASNCDKLTVYGQSKVGNIFQAYIYGVQNKKNGIISLSVHPGYLNTELQRSYNAFRRFISKFFVKPAIYGSYTELFALLYPNITVEQNGRYIGPWGNFRQIRQDVEEGLTNGTAQKFWDWADREVEPYM